MQKGPLADLKLIVVEVVVWFKIKVSVDTCQDYREYDPNFCRHVMVFKYELNLLEEGGVGLRKKLD